MKICDVRAVAVFTILRCRLLRAGPDMAWVFVQSHAMVRRLSSQNIVLQQIVNVEKSDSTYDDGIAPVVDDVRLAE